MIHNLLAAEIANTIEKLGLKWEEILKEYEKKYESMDSIHWYLERTNVGALATSAWLCGGVSLEEYTTKKENSKEYNGRCDLYFHINDLKAVCESKMKWIEIRDGESGTKLHEVVNGINSVIQSAQSDSNAHITHHRKMFASFICTCWKNEEDGTIDQSNIEFIIEGILKNQENAASFKFKTDKKLVSSSGNVCNLAYLVIGDA